MRITLRTRFRQYLTRRRQDRPHHVIYLPLVIAFCSLLGGIYGPRVEVAAAATEDDIKSSLKVFTRVYNAVEENFVDPRDFQSLQEDQKGHYYGTGMTVAQHNRKIVIILPQVGAPAYKAGLRP